MKISFNIGRDLKNPYTQKQMQRRTNVQRTNVHFSPINNTIQKSDFVTFTGTAKPVISTKEQGFDHVDKLLSSTNNIPAQKVAAEITQGLKSILHIEEKTVSSFAQGIKTELDKKTDRILKQYAEKILPQGTQIIKERTADGAIIRKITFENGNLASIEEDGPYDTKNIIIFEKGQLEKYVAGFSRLKDKTTTSEFEISYWPNGKLMHFMKNYRQNGMEEIADREGFYSPKGTLDLYIENCKRYHYSPISMKRSIRRKNTQFGYIKNYNANEKPTSTEISVKLSKGNFTELKLNNKDCLD